MKKIGSGFSHRRCGRPLVLLAGAVFLLAALAPCAVKLTYGNASSLKLSEHITEYFSLGVDLFKSPTGTYSERSVPRILLSAGGNPELLLFNGTRLAGFDCRDRKLGNAFASPEKNIRRVLPAQAVGRIYLWGDELTRFDLASGKADWAKKLDLSRTFKVNAMTEFWFPTLIRELAGKNRLAVVGLQKEPKGYKYRNKIMVFDAGTGATVSDREFHYRRKLSGSLEMFVNTASWEFEIMDLDTLESQLQGKLDPLDLLQPYDHLAIDANKMNIDLPASRKEINARFLGSGFMLASRELYMTGAVETSKWVIFDEAGKKTKTISPAPLTAFDYAVSNLGAGAWPVYMLHTYHRKIRVPRVDRIIALEKDGSFAEYELPAIEGIDEFILNPVRNWFHVGDVFYYTRDGNLYRFKLGEKTGECIYAADKSDGCETVEARDAKYVMLKPPLADLNLAAILIRFADGKKIAPSEFNEKLDTNLWKMVVDANQSLLPLPASGVFPGCKGYRPYNCVLDMQGEMKRAARVKFNRGVLMFKVWGDYPRSGGYGDIGIVTAEMADKSAALIGISIADNKPLFSVPVLEFSGLNAPEYANIFPDGRYLPFNIVRLNDMEALLVVFEKTDLLKIYKLKRP